MPLSHLSPPGTAPKPQPPCAGARDKPRCTAGGIPSPASAPFSNGMGDALRMGCDGGALSGAPQRRGTDPDGSSWLTPRTPRPQAWQPSGAPGTECPPGLPVPGPMGPTIALRHPPEPQGCPSPPKVPVVPQGAHPTRGARHPKVPAAPRSARSPPEGLGLAAASASPSCPPSSCCCPVA